MTGVVVDVGESLGCVKNFDSNRAAGADVCPRGRGVRACCSSVVASAVIIVPLSCKL